MNQFTEAERLDLSAVAETLDSLSAAGDYLSISAVKEIYFFDAHSKYERDKLSEKILQFSLKNNIEKKTTRACINKAMMIFINIRVLRLERKK